MKTFFLAVAALFISISPSLSAIGDSTKASQKEILQLLSSGKQSAAEAKLIALLKGDPKNPDHLFLTAVLARSRFNVRGAAPIFAFVLKTRPDSPEGLVSACVLGIDLSRDQWTSLYYFNALLIVCDQNPNSIPIHWMAAVMARTLSKRDDFKLNRPDVGQEFNLGAPVHKRILLCGVREYETVLSLMAPGEGPVLVHETMGNLLDSLGGYDLALKHREITLRQERRSWSLQSSAITLIGLGRSAEALPLVQEAVALDANQAAFYSTLATAYTNLGRKADAINALDLACKIEPRNQKYPRNAAMRHRELGNYAAAREYIRKALANEPNNRFYKIWDARFAALLGEPGAGALIHKAGLFDFRGNIVDFDPPSSDPWFAAVETGDLQKFRQLIGTEDINRQEKESGQNALMIAARDGWDTIAEELIKAGAKLDEVDNSGNTALHYSTQFNNQRVLKLLVEAGANLNIQDKWKQTPLIMCVSKSNQEGIQMLLEKHADVHLSKPNGTPLHYAAGHGGLVPLNALLKYGADVNAVNESGETPLISASKDYPHPFIVNPLLKAGARVNAQDNTGCTALYHAINPLLNLPLVELLLEKGGDPSMKNKSGTSPITRARLLGFDEIASAMEEKIHRTEPFQFPQFAPADAGVSREAQNASLFVLPILLAQGDPIGRPSGVQYGDKEAACNELKWMFGIYDAEDMKEVLDALEKFEPRYRENSADLPLPLPLQQLSVLLKAAAIKIHASCNSEATDETAWIKSHIIYLADLGICAGFIPQEEGDKLIANASSELSRTFSSWPQYLNSFVLGAQFHSGWEAHRYRNLCKRILAAGPRWP